MNSKYIKIFVFVLYASISCESFLYAINAYGISVDLSLSVVIIAFWLLFCVWSGPYFAEYSIFRHQRIRKPILIEEHKVNPILTELQRACGLKKPLRLLILEEEAVNAYSIGLRTIVISKSMISLFLPEEIRGMIAHEMGHLVSHDRMIGTAYNTAADFSQALHRFIQRFSFLFFLASIVIFLLGYIKTGEYHFGVLLFLPLYLSIYPKFHRLLLFCWRAINRHRKYEHDAFACSLGYGHDLLNFLYRISMSEEMPVNSFDAIMHGNSPVIYNRIRRIEEILGFRAQWMNAKNAVTSDFN